MYIIQCCKSGDLSTMHMEKWQILQGPVKTSILFIWRMICWSDMIYFQKYFFLCPVGLSTFHPLLRVIHSTVLSFLLPILYNFPFYIIVELLGSTLPMIFLLCCESFLPNVWLLSASSSAFPHWDMISPSHYPCKYPTFFLVSMSYFIGMKSHHVVGTAVIVLLLRTWRISIRWPNMGCASWCGFDTLFSRWQAYIFRWAEAQIDYMNDDAAYVFEQTFNAFWCGTNGLWHAISHNSLWML